MPQEREEGDDVQGDTGGGVTHTDPVDSLSCNKLLWCC